MVPTVHTFTDEERNTEENPSFILQAAVFLPLPSPWDMHFSEKQGSDWEHWPYIFKPGSLGQAHGKIPPNLITP